MEPDNHDRGAFEGKVCSDLEWIKAAIKSIQCLCNDRGKRIADCESSIMSFQNVAKCVQGHEDRIRAAENGLTQVKAIGGIMGTLGGILASVGIKLWGGHS